jgi:hypothetical protein
MNKKAMGVSQVFIYILAIVTFSLIMIFGFKAIFGISDDINKIEFIQFKNDLENSVKQVSSEFAAVRNEEFRTSSVFQQICFIDLDYGPAPGEVEKLCDLDPVACFTWEESTGFSTEEENVFLTPSAKVRIKVSRIELEEGFLCLPIRNSKFFLRLEGKGDRTKITGIS